MANFPAHAVDAGNRPDVNRYRELQRAVQRLNLAPDQRGHDMAALRKQLKQAQQRADEALREQRRANDEFRQAMANFPNGLQHARVGRFDPLLGQLDDRRGGVDEWHVGLQQQPPA